MKKKLILKLLLLLASSSFADEINCKYYSWNDCYMTNVFEEPIEATSVTGNHQGNEMNAGSFIVEHQCSTKYYPTRMCSHLKNLNTFSLYAPKIVELRREIFKGCVKLTSITILNFQLKKLEEDLFADVPTLEIILLGNSKLEVLQRDIFKNNQALKRVYLSSNKLKIIDVDFPKSLTVLSLTANVCINAEYDPTEFSYDLFSNSPTLDQVIKKVEKNCRNSTTTEPPFLETSDTNTKEIDQNNSNKSSINLKTNIPKPLRNRPRLPYFQNKENLEI